MHFIPYLLSVLWLITFINGCNAFSLFGKNNTATELKKLAPIIQSTTDAWHTFNNEYTTLPATFDARKHWPLCKSIADVKNQGSCKSGWAVAVASVITDRMCINQRHPVTDLSAYNLLSCCENCCGCRGGTILNAWEYVKEEGILTGGSFGSQEGCQPYIIPPCNGKLGKFDECSWRSDLVPDCLPTKCTNKKNLVGKHFGGKHRIKGYTILPQKNDEAIMRELFLNGPIQVSMHFYDDFRWYERGFYTRSTGHFEGEHAVKLIGWDEHRNWLLINSFGKKWGDEGTFLVPPDRSKSNCEFGYAIIAPKLNGTKWSFSDAISLRTDCKSCILNSVLLYNIVLIIFY